MSTYDPNKVASSGGDLIRPYLATAGRTTSRVEGLKLETLVQQTGTTPTTRFESTKVYQLCELPISLAELSAHLSMPVGLGEGDRGRLDQFRRPQVPSNLRRFGF